MNDGGPAYPGADTQKLAQAMLKMQEALESGADDKEAIKTILADLTIACNPGMSLRQHYVGRALTGLLATPFDAPQGANWTGWASSTAFGMADAMIAFEANEKK